MSTDRRTFLKLLGSPAVAAALPDNITKLLSTEAHRRSGTIADVEHIIILTQENRSFDHYFGTMRGVRGFADPRVAKLQNGQPVWNQPAGSGTLLPFRPNVPDVGQMFLPDPPHGWNDGHRAWNWGAFDQWGSSPRRCSSSTSTRRAGSSTTWCRPHRPSMRDSADPPCRRRTKSTRVIRVTRLPRTGSASGCQ